MKFWVLLLISLALMGVANVAPSSTPLYNLVTYDFTVTATSGPLSGDTSSGSFTYVSTIAPAGGGDFRASELFASLSFTWDGIAYTRATANTGDLAFNAAGTLVGGGFGTDCEAGGCSESEFTNQWFAVFPDSGFTYATPTALGGNGTISLSLASIVPGPPPPSVPEPATLPLLALGLSGVGLMRRRKGSKVPRSHEVFN